jgi:methyl-accepting chemotaxis protein
MTDKISRKHVLLLPSYQVKLVGFLVAVALVGSLIHGFCLYSLTARSIEEGFLSVHNRLRSTWEILKPAIILTNGLSFVVLSLAFLAITIFISHRLIGPVFKTSNRLRDIAEGKWHLPPIKLRRGDEGQMLSDSVNQLQGNLNQRFLPLREVQERLKKGETVSATEMQSALDKALQGVEWQERSSS